MTLPSPALKYLIVIGSFALAGMILAAFAGYRLEVRKLGLIFEPAPILMSSHQVETAVTPSSQSPVFSRPMVAKRGEKGR